MTRKTKVERVAIVDFKYAQKELEMRLNRTGMLFEDLIDSPEEETITPEEREKRRLEHNSEIRDEIQALKKLKKSSERAPVFFENEYAIPHCLKRRAQIKSSYGDIFFLFRERIYVASGPHTSDELQLLVFREAERERKEFESLHSKYLESQKPGEAKPKNSRKSIPQKVRREVWRRDQGTCVQCGSRENIEFDHIIPVAKGGGNTARNIELLCETCNRKKGASID